MDIVLQAWGGGFYLLHKILFSISETNNEKRKRIFRIIGWIVYILGVPPWVIILVMQHNWIAASIELGGLPAMVFGLYNVLKNNRQPSKKLHGIALLSTYLFIFTGIAYSTYQNHGITSLTQLLEIGVTVGFLSGSYLLAKNNYNGWLFFALMNISMGLLMLLQNKPILAVQQGLSLLFVIYGLVSSIKILKRQRLTANAV